MREVDADVRDAAKAMGLTGGQVLRTVEAPLAVPFVMAGMRTASIEVVATSTLAAYVSYADLGTPVISGLNTNDTWSPSRGAARGRCWPAWWRWPQPPDQGAHARSPAPSEPASALAGRRRRPAVACNLTC